MTVEPDYVTIIATIDPHKFLVAVMTYRQRDDEYIQKKVSQHALTHVAAQMLADTWAAALHLERR